MEWITIRGPIGGPRQDYYQANLAMHAGGPYEKSVPFKDFMMPWLKPGEVNVSEFITPWIDDGDDDEEIRLRH